MKSIVLCSDGTGNKGGYGAIQRHCFYLDNRRKTYINRLDKICSQMSELL